MGEKKIGRELSCKVLMVGECFKGNAPGGMAAVVQYYNEYIDGLRYVASWKLSNFFVRLWYAVWGLLSIFFILLIDRRIRLVHIHTAEGASFWRNGLYLSLAKRMGRKTLLHVHASEFVRFYEESNKKEDILSTIGKADLLIVLSESWRKYFIGIGVDESKITVLHNITDYPSSRYEKDYGKVNMLFLGLIGPRKGVFELLSSMSKHKEELRGKVELRIGGNTNEDRLREAIREGGLEEMVRFEGWVSGEKKKDLLGWANVYVLPSHNEGLPISILEAMSYGCAIISTPVGGIPEVVDDGYNGYLVDPGDEEGIFRAINSYVEDKAKIRDHGKGSKERVKEYLPDYVMKELSGIYMRLL